MGLTPGGVMTDADVLEAEVKRAMLEHADQRVLLLDQFQARRRAVSRRSRRSRTRRWCSPTMAQEGAEHIEALGQKVRRVQ